MELLGDLGHVESRSVRLEMVLVLVQDWGRVCAERTIGSDIVWNAAHGPPRRHGSCRISFGPFGDGVSVDVR